MRRTSKTEGTGDPVSQALTGPEKGLALAVVACNLLLAYALAQGARFPSADPEGVDVAEPLRLDGGPRIAAALEPTSR